MPYDELEPGEGLLIEPGRVVKVRCCDCGLVHRTTYEFVGPKTVIYRTYRDERSTAAGRRFMEPVTFGTKKLKKEKGTHHAK